MSLKTIAVSAALILILGTTSAAFAMGGGGHHRGGGGNGNGNSGPQTDVTGGNSAAFTDTLFHQNSDGTVVEQTGPLSSVPEPATTLLVGSSLVGLLALARRRK